MGKKKAKKKVVEPPPELDGSSVDSGEGFFALFRGDRFEPAWLVNCSLITALAAYLRFFWLELKPFHHDEGVNGHFLTRLFREDLYQYDPSNYHGPDLYYFALAFSKVFGLNTLSVRGSVAIFGVLTVVLAFFLKRYIGKSGSLAAALFLALSPGMVFVSRYFIHEILFVFFTLSFVVAILYFVEKRKAGVFSVGWMALLLMICFIPPALRLPQLIVTEGSVWLWVLRIVIFAVEAVLVFLVMRMLMLWNGGRPIYLFLAAASLIFLFATKETAFITVGTMLIAWVSVRLWQKTNSSRYFRSNRAKHYILFHGILGAIVAGVTFKYFQPIKDFFVRLGEFFNDQNGPDQTYLFYSVIFLLLASLLTWLIFLVYEIREEPALQGPWGQSGFAEPSWKGFRSAIGGKLDVTLTSVSCAFVFIYVGVLFFSSFFTYPKGVLGAVEAYAIWTTTGSKDHTMNGYAGYLRWLLEIEAPILALSLVGTIIAMIKARHRVAMFTALWAFGLFLAYTIIPYKTPWLALSFILPMCIIAGYGIGQLAASKDHVQKILAGVLTVVGVAVLSIQTYDLNFVRYDDERMAYVYAQTRRGFLDMIKEIDRTADRSPRKKESGIDIVSSDYWPMPWYVNDYSNAGFHGKMVDSSADMIVASKSQLGELGPKFGNNYVIAGEYPLRPGVDLYLLVKKELAGPGAKKISEVGN